MTEGQFKLFLAEANEELRQKQDALQKEYGLETYSRWFFEQSTAILQFFDEKNILHLEADIIDIGSYSPKSSTWLWAWANVSVLPELRHKFEKLKELKQITGYEWELAALAVKYLGAKGCYRAPSSARDLHSFFAMMSLWRTQ